jgi:RNA polymerase sigma-70 factor (ECF subfamily)
MMASVTLAPPDPAIVLRAQRGDLDARDRLLEDTFRRVYRYFLRLARGDAESAMEGAQEVMLRLLGALGGLRDPARFLPWALRIATNLWRDGFRARRVESLGAVERVAASERGDPPDDVVRQLDALPEPYRTALTLRYLQALDYEAMSDVLDVPATTLRSHVARGLRMIRERMEGEVEP